MKAFEVKVKYEKMMEDGTNKIVSEVFLTDAISFCEAEAIICKEMEYIQEEDFKVLPASEVPF